MLARNCHCNELKGGQISKALSWRRQIRPIHDLDVNPFATIYFSFEATIVTNAFIGLTVRMTYNIFTVFTLSSI